MRLIDQRNSRKLAALKKRRLSRSRVRIALAQEIARRRRSEAAWSVYPAAWDAIEREVQTRLAFKSMRSLAMPYNPMLFARALGLGERA